MKSTTSTRVRKPIAKSNFKAIVSEKKEALKNPKVKALPDPFKLKIGSTITLLSKKPNKKGNLPHKKYIVDAIADGKAFLGFEENPYVRLVAQEKLDNQNNPVFIGVGNPFRNFDIKAKI